MAILEFEFKNDNNVFAYLHYLMAEDLQYHFDDDPFEIDWQAKQISYAEKSALYRNHMRLWAYCNPWAWFDRHEQMWSAWTGGSEVSTHPHASKPDNGDKSFITNVKTEHTGGNCFVDVITLHDGRYIGITDEVIIFYRKPVNDEDYLSDEAFLDQIVIC